MRRMATMVVAALSLILLPLSPNFYNYPTNALVCTTSDGCMHEIGHKMDDDMNAPSRSGDFGNALRAYLIFAAKYDQWDVYSRTILTYDGLFQYSSVYSVTGGEKFSSPQEELYADFYKLSGGDINALPEIFREFYSTDNSYQTLYQCLMTTRICGTSFRLGG